MTWSTIDNKELADLRATVAAQEEMLTHASDTIARLEGRWRAPGAAKAGQKALVIEVGTLDRFVAPCLEDGGQWMDPQSFEVTILAWCELPAIPADEMYAGLT